MSSLYLVVGIGIVLWLFVLLHQWVHKPFHAHTVAVNQNCNLGKVAAVHSIQGARGHMEDSYYGDHKTGFFAVYDGHGGARCSAYAAAHLHSLIYKHTHIDPLQSAHPSSSPKSKRHKITKSELPSKTGDPVIINGIYEAFDELDKSWLSLATLYNYDDGSTAIVCLIHNRTLYIANVGDSRAVLVTSDGKAVEMSRDHKPSRPDEKSRVEQLGGRIIYYGTWRIEGSLAVSRSFGDRRLKRYICSQPDLNIHPITENDEFLILASDGVWDCLKSEDAAQLVYSNRDLSIQQLSTKITDQAYKLHSQDNITSMVVDLRQYR